VQRFAAVPRSRPRDGCAAIVASVITLGVSITAKGVDTSEQLAVLRPAGCTEVQGHFFSRPIPSAELTARLSASNSEVAAA